MYTPVTSHRPARSPSRPHKVLHLDPHPLYRLGLRSLLDGKATLLQLHEAHSLGEARRLCHEHGDFDLVLMETELTDSSGLAGAVQLKANAPMTRIALLCERPNPQICHQAMRHGLAGALDKQSPAHELLIALRALLRGEEYWPIPSQQGAELPHLTPRQLDVLTLLVQGQQNKAISEVLGMAQGTVRIHVSAILKALGAKNRTQAGITALQLGLIRPEGEVLRPVAQPTVREGLGFPAAMAMAV